MWGWGSHSGGTKLHFPIPAGPEAARGWRRQELLRSQKFHPSTSALGWLCCCGALRAGIESWQGRAEPFHPKFVLWQHREGTNLALHGASSHSTVREGKIPQSSCSHRAGLCFPHPCRVPNFHMQPGFDESQPHQG